MEQQTNSIPNALKLFILVIATIIIQIIISVFSFILGVIEYTTKEYSDVFISDIFFEISLSLSSIIAVSLCLWWFDHKILWKTEFLQFKGNLLNLVWSLFLSIGLSSLVFVILIQRGALISVSQSSFSQTILLDILLLLIICWGEELLYRGYLLTFNQGNKISKFVLVLSMFFFVLFHGNAFPETLFEVLNRLILGTTLIMIFLKVKNVWVTFLYNFGWSVTSKLFFVIWKTEFLTNFVKGVSGLSDLHLDILNGGIMGSYFATILLLVGLLLMLFMKKKDYR